MDRGLQTQHMSSASSSGMGCKAHPPMWAQTIHSLRLSMEKKFPQSAGSTAPCRRVFSQVGFLPNATQRPGFKQLQVSFFPHLSASPRPREPLPPFVDIWDGNCFLFLLVASTFFTGLIPLSNYGATTKPSTNHPCNERRTTFRYP